MARYEGARKTGRAIVVCTTPDVCKTPMGSSTPPVPYQITANFSDSASVSHTKGQALKPSTIST